MDVRYLILSLFFLVSCMPSAQVSKGNLENTETTSGSSSGGTTTTPTSLTWNYLGQPATTITINVSNLQNAYIVGTPVETYLSSAANFTNANYCLVSSYTLGGVAHELRSRIVPISYYDFKAKRTVKVFRVDFQDVTNSSAFCNETLRTLNNSGTLVVDSSGPAPKFDPATICPLCTSMLNASRVRLFKVNEMSMPAVTYLDEVPFTLVNVPGLSLQVDPNYSTTGNAGSCSNTDCRARGFDCCLDNQCVQDGATRPSAITQYSSQLQVAEQERLSNPMAYLNYPQLYYICGSSVPSTTTGGAGGSGGSYDAAFELLKKDYYCIENLKSQSTTTPFHNEVLTKSYTPATNCLTGASETEQEMYYKNVLKRMYTTCGCNRTDLTDMVANCPNYDYTVVTRDTANQPVRIDCYTPPTNTTPVPQQQSVSVSSRSAPHRFFDTTGVEKDITSGAEQEGDRFEYMDEGKVLPLQQSFSMNAILGQMSVALDQALPAKTVNVELDQVYFLSTTSGYYSPCPTCAKDSWLNAFTAFPSTAMGTGLQAIGHTTERDTFSTNTTSGNYEDTIFGRACWLPPTMIPFSHSAKSAVKDQRLNRLQTQAALFVNGYQRDWFGFNKGALIGSFDGVTWFAIGKGRIVRSTSKKLYLAINAPFADVATPTMHVVRVFAYDGVTEAAQVDYDPQYHQYHPFQNEAGNCQKYHMCSTDTDCVTKLGWEYACADVKDLKTNWPSFDADSNEVANTSTSLSLDQILQQKRFPSASTKRCVYRGAGSLCHTNSGSLSSTDLNKRKLLTCGPNFYCASTGSAVHNNKIARYAAALEEIPVSRNHFFGKDANILGRPMNYMGDQSILSTIRSTLVDNVTAFESSLSSGLGICQPGRNLPNNTNETSMSNPFTQHMTGDSLKRSDFINQIGSCNPTLFTDKRHTSCPVIGADGNYEMFAAATIAPGYNLRATNQNACGLESLLNTASLSASADTLSSSSPFRTIEAKTLNSQIIVDPTLARDACFRRAGAVCHTDLDCSPNKMHATQVDFFGTNFFGNLAEKSYWSEYLVCGQTDAKPLPSNTEAFKNYDMSQNRCCREIGKDLTTYTADIPSDTFVNVSKPYDPVSAGLNMSVAPGIDPRDPKRYSRLATVANLGTINPILTANIDRNPSDASRLDPVKKNAFTADQWKTLSEANSESCCGGGWVRKFSDGSNDWTRRDRMVLDVANFRCINSRTPLITDPAVLAAEYDSATEVTSLVGQDYGDYCKDGTNTNGACAQFSILDSASDVLPSGPLAFGTITVNTVKPSYSSTANPDNYFMPRSADANPGVIVDYNDSSASARRNITIKLPSFINRDFDDALVGVVNLTQTPLIKMMIDDVTGLDCYRQDAFNPTSPTTSAGAGVNGATANCVFSFNRTTRILKVGANTLASTTTFNNKKVGVRFSNSAPGSASGIVRTKPGTSAYYLRRLGRLELTGIPQINYEVLTCNDNSSRVIQGIFKTGITTQTQFNSNSYSWLRQYQAKDSTGATTFPTRRFTNVKGLQLEPVFSANDFKCCSPLGKTVTDTSKCCSGFGVAVSEDSNDKTCALPAGTDLMVYFNRFVSNEGRGTEQPGGGLVDADFESQTGEPVLTTVVNDKIRALGAEYCASGKVRQGGAFGSFEPEPQGSGTDLTSRIYNIVDSARDVGTNSNAGSTSATGYPAFTDGFRWNHHLYCDD